MIRNGESWSPLARISYEQDRSAAAASRYGEAPLTSFIEAGETENLYFRVVIPCKPLLRMYVTSRFEKPKMPWEGFSETLSWVKQTYVDASQYCPEPPPAAAQHPTKRKH